MALAERLGYCLAHMESTTAEQANAVRSLDQSAARAEARLQHAHADSARMLRHTAAVGALLWLLYLVIFEPDLVKSTLAFGLFTVIPLALGLLLPGAGHRAYGWLPFLVPAAAIGAVFSLTLEPKPAAALFALPWFATTVLGSTIGLLRLKDAGGGPGLAENLGLCLLPIGGAWLLFSRAAFDPLGLGPLLVLLTAVHFHFAAFAALALVSHSARAMAGAGSAEQRQRDAKLVAWVVVALAAGTFLVAAGVSGVLSLGMLGAALLTLGLWVHAALTLIRVVRHLQHWLPKVLLSLSALSLLLSMPLALAYAWSQLTGVSSVELEAMLRFHGMANAYGFVLAGFLAWWLQARASGQSHRAIETAARSK